MTNNVRYRISPGFSPTQHQLRGLLTGTNAAARGWNRENIRYTAESLRAISSKIPEHITKSLEVEVYLSDGDIKTCPGSVEIKRDARTITFQLGTMWADNSSIDLIQSQYADAMAGFIFDPENTFDTANAGLVYTSLDLSTRSPFLTQSRFTIVPDFAPYVSLLLDDVLQPGAFIKEEVVVGDPGQYLGSAKIISLSPSFYTLMANIRRNIRQVASDKITWLIAPHLLGTSRMVDSIRTVADKADSTLEASLENAWDWTALSVALAAACTQPVTLNKGPGISEMVQSTLSTLAQNKAQALLLLSYFEPGYADDSITNPYGIYKPGALNPIIPASDVISSRNFGLVLTKLEDIFLREVEFLFANCLEGYLDLYSQTDFA